MLQIEQRLRQGFSHWLRGQRGRITQPLPRTLGRWPRLDAIETFPARDGHRRDFDGPIEVDLHCIRPKKRKRYLQRALAA